MTNENISKANKMSKCSQCNKQACIELGKRKYCKDHFVKQFEKKVAKVIKDHKLFSKKEKIVCACSGGKDSLTVLVMLKKLGYNPTALLIDEGIKGYRAKTIEDMKIFCKQYNIGYNIASFEDEFGFTLDKVLKKHKGNKPCTVCGVLRRYLLNKYSKKFDVIATGHNLDDEAQSIMMNILKANNQLIARLGPRTGLVHDKRFTKRVKPLYMCYEKEIKLYTILNNIRVHFTECPYSHLSFRADVCDMLNNIECKKPGTKLALVQRFLKDLPLIKRRLISKEKIATCPKCGEPSNQANCKACQLIKRLKC